MTMSHPSHVQCHNITVRLTSYIGGLLYNSLNVIDNLHYVHLV